MSNLGLDLGRRVAPPRFILFALTFAAGLAAFIPWLGRTRGVLIAFDVAAIVFLAAMSTVLWRGGARRMRQAARENDANRAVLLGFTGVTMLVILVAVASELKGKNDAVAIALVITTLALTWLFANVVYALHYAHLYYVEEDGRDARGLDFPDCDEPDYWDFLYFSMTLGMTFQTSDVEIRTGRLRRVALGHTLVGFVFNLGILAFTINVLGGS